MHTESERSQRNAAAFDLASEGYVSPALSFFDVFGERIVESVGVKAGDRVLDLGCGAGALTLPAARATGPAGHVAAVDISEGMLNLARRRVEEQNLGWVSFHQGDVLSLDMDKDFDVALCGFVVQMFDDRTAPLRQFTRSVLEGGRVAWSMWGEGAFEPHLTVYRAVLTRVRPDLVSGPSNLQRLHQPGIVESLMAEAGIKDVSLVPVQHSHLLRDFDEYWHLLTNTGFRETLMKLSDGEMVEFREALQRDIAEVSDEDGGLTLDMPCQFVVGTV